MPFWQMFPRSMTPSWLLQEASSSHLFMRAVGPCIIYRRQRIYWASITIDKSLSRTLLTLYCKVSKLNLYTSELATTLHNCGVRIAVASTWSEADVWTTTVTRFQTMITNLMSHVCEMAATCAAVTRGDLTRKVSLEVCPIRPYACLDVPLIKVPRARPRVNSWKPKILSMQWLTM